MLPNGNRRRSGENRSSSKNRNGDPFVSTFSTGVTPRLPNPAVRRNHLGGKEKLRLRDIPSASAHTSAIKLHQSENAWRPLHRIIPNVEGSPEDLEREKLKRNVQSVLNKLTFQKFKILFAHLKKLNIYTETEMDLVADLIYENAILEPNFSVLYANLCKHLAMINMPTSKMSEEQIDFTTVLLTKCQKEFEEHCNTPTEKIHQAMEANDLETEKLSNQRKEEIKKLKMRRIGNIRFIGELFKLNMILKPVLQECIEILLMNEDEESLECLCLLIKTAGKELENQGNCTEKQETEEYFVKIQKIVDEHVISTRIRFLLKDILDLKINNWVPRRIENVPRTIDEIHKEVALEARKQWQWYQNMMFIAAQSDKQDQNNAPTDHTACVCEDEMPKLSKSTGGLCVSDCSTSNIDTLDEARRILLAKGRKGKQNSFKNRNQRKSSHVRSENRTDSTDCASTSKL